MTYGVVDVHGNGCFQIAPRFIHLDLRLNPLHYVANPQEKSFSIPWCLQGAFVFSLIEAHVMSALLHKEVSRQWRLETAMTGALACCNQRVG